MDSAIPIFSRVNESGTVFISLERALSNSSRFAAQVRPEHIKDEFDRFKIWAGNIAAHRKGRRSLEYRLRDAALLKAEVHNLLTALHDSLQTSIVQEKRTPWDELPDSESDSDSDNEVSDDAEAQGDTELKQLLGSIKTTITCLFRLSMSIRDPAPNDQSRSIITVDKSYFEEYDMQHAKAKYPGCADYLVERLGRANSGRRQYLSYREEHHQKLAKDVDLIGLEVPRTEHTNNSTEATPMPKAGVDSLEILDSDDALSHTSYATISWQCVEGCGKIFSFEKDFDRHVQTSHPDLGQPDMLSALKWAAAKRASLSDEAHCPLCDQRMTLRLLQRHVARHQEQLALFALPPNLEDDPQEEERETYVRASQDEGFSDVGDTLDVNEPAGEEQVPVGGSSPEALKNSVQELDAIALEFRKNVVPELVKLKEDCDVEEAGEGSLRKIEEEAGATGVEPSPMSKLLYDYPLPRSDADAESNHVTLSSPHSMVVEIDSDEDTRPQPKGILPKPTEKFPEDPNPDRKGVAPLGHNEDIPPEARWTKIHRKLVNTEALTEARERFEVDLDHVVVLRVLSPKEIQELAERTKELCELREAAKRDRETPSPKGKRVAVSAESDSGSEITYSYTGPAESHVEEDSSEVIPRGGVDQYPLMEDIKQPRVAANDDDSNPGNSEEKQPDSRHGRG
ncbi:hypothetical protein DL771_002629 [Monosporascus sp. 5C6A]|nr:hypothetical protein DL771_002629 [Monosporascus sp. 5C6A]